MKTIYILDIRAREEQDKMFKEMYLAWQKQQKKMKRIVLKRGF